MSNLFRHNFENSLLCMIFPLKLLNPGKQPMAGPSSSDGKIMEGDNFQNYGGKDQCIYM